MAFIFESISGTKYLKKKMEVNSVFDNIFSPLL